MLAAAILALFLVLGCNPSRNEEGGEQSEQDAVEKGLQALQLPVLLSVYPTTGEAVGGEAVRVCVASYYDDLEISMGGVDSPEVSIQGRNNDNCPPFPGLGDPPPDILELRVVTPPHNPGAVSIVAVSPDGGVDMLQEGFVYLKSGPPALLASLSAEPTKVEVGDLVTVTLTVSNVDPETGDLGGEAALDTTPSSLYIGGDIGAANLLLVSGPSPVKQEVPVGEPQRFVYSYRALKDGLVNFCGRVRGRSPDSAASPVACPGCDPNRASCLCGCASDCHGQCQTDCEARGLENCSAVCSLVQGEDLCAACSGNNCSAICELTGSLGLCQAECDLSVCPAVGAEAEGTLEFSPVQFSNDVKASPLHYSLVPPALEVNAADRMVVRANVVNRSSQTISGVEALALAPEILSGVIHLEQQSIYAAPDVSIGPGETYTRDFVYRTEAADSGKVRFSGAARGLAPAERSLLGVWTSSAGEAVVVGENGRSLFYDGEAWTRRATGGLWRLNGVWGASSSDIYAVEGDLEYRYSDGALQSIAPHGSIYHYNGSEWTLASDGGGRPLYGIWGASAESIFAVGGAGLILHSNGGAWGSMETLSTRTLWDVWGSSAADVYAVGAAGTILHYDGAAWTAMESGSVWSLRGVWGSSAQNVFAVGRHGTVLRRQGESWSAMESGSTADLYGVWGSSPTEIFAVGEGGVILRYDGFVWKKAQSGTTTDLFAVWGSSVSGEVFAAGGDGTLLHYDGNSWRRTDPGEADEVSQFSRETSLTQESPIISVLPEVVQPLTVTVEARILSDSLPYKVAFQALVSGGVPPYKFLWDFGDLVQSVEQNPIHSYIAVGNYAPFVEATDAAGGTSLYSVALHVVESVDQCGEGTEGTVVACLDHSVYGEPVEMVLDASYVYFATADGRLWRVGRNGGTPELLGGIDGFVEQLQQDDENLYFLDWKRRDFLSLPKAGGETSTLDTGYLTLADRRTAPGYIYMTARAVDDPFIFQDQMGLGEDVVVARKAIGTDAAWEPAVTQTLVEGESGFEQVPQFDSYILGFLENKLYFASRRTETETRIYRIGLDDPPDQVERVGAFSSILVPNPVSDHGAVLGPWTEESEGVRSNLCCWAALNGVGCYKLEETTVVDAETGEAKTSLDFTAYKVYNKSVTNHAVTDGTRIFYLPSQFSLSGELLEIRSLGGLAYHRAGNPGAYYNGGVAPMIAADGERVYYLQRSGDSRTALKYQDVTAQVGGIEVAEIPDQYAETQQPFQLDIAPYISSVGPLDDYVFEILAGGGSFSGTVYTNSFPSPGTVTVVFLVRDPLGAIGTGVITVEVAASAESEPLTLATIPAQTATAGLLFALDLSSYAAGGQSAYVYEVVSGGGSFVGALYTNTFAEAGENRVVVRVTSGQEEVQGEIVITVVQNPETSSQ